MSERFPIRRVNGNTELYPADSESNVRPFPVQRWKEPLPVVPEHVAPKPKAEREETKSDLRRFYPPLLLLSTAMTAAFFALYLTKPVVTISSNDNTSAIELNSQAVVLDSQDELIPWPKEAADVIAPEPVAKPSLLPPSQLPTAISPPKGVLVPEVHLAGAVTDPSAIDEARLIEQALDDNLLKAKLLRDENHRLELQWQSLLQTTAQN